MSMEIHIKKNGPIKAYTKLMIKYAKLLNENNRLKNMVEKMQCCYNCKKWNDGECEESPKSKTFFCADFKCESWECIE